MKTQYLEAIVLIAFSPLLFIGCSRNEGDFVIKKENPYFTSLNDTIIYLPEFYGTANFSLDLDKDSITDAIITFHSHYTAYSGAEDYKKITPLNGYEISYLENQVKTWNYNPILEDTTYNLNTVIIVKCYELGDTIFALYPFTQDPAMIYYSSFPTGPGSGLSSGLNYGLNDNKEFYVGFRKLHSNFHNLAWLKIRIYFTGEILLSSCFYSDNGNYLIINKP